MPGRFACLSLVGAPEVDPDDDDRRLAAAVALT
jgi:hypothetical protein